MSDIPVTQDMVENFTAAWHEADIEGDHGNRVRRGLRAVMALLDDTSVDVVAVLGHQWGKQRLTHLVARARLLAERSRNYTDRTGGGPLFGDADELVHALAEVDVDPSGSQPVTVHHVATFVETMQAELALGASEEHAIRRGLTAVQTMPPRYHIGSEVFTIAPTSCACGGAWAWMKRRPTGAWEMVGCICHTYPDGSPVIENEDHAPQPQGSPLRRLLMEALDHTETDHLVTRQAAEDVATEMEHYLTSEPLDDAIRNSR